jgi:NAD(P)-dependent dehydrogenase (short-subunit alcohol dehydrogenase family)
MLGLTDSVFLITQTNHGKGLAVAEALHARGCRLSCGVRNQARLADFHAKRDTARLHVPPFDPQAWSDQASWLMDPTTRFACPFSGTAMTKAQP